jgi:hypothetical protein
VSHPGISSGPVGPSGATPHFGAQRPDHSPPELLGDDELARAVDSLTRKLHSARRMLALAYGARVTLYAAIVVGGVAVLGLGPAPFLELIEGQRQVATAWEVFLWWAAALGATSLFGALLVQAVRRRKRRATGWKHRVHDLDRRLTEALEEQARRRAR